MLLRLPGAMSALLMRLSEAAASYILMESHLRHQVRECGGRNCAIVGLGRTTAQDSCLLSLINTHLRHDVSEVVDEQRHRRAGPDCCHGGCHRRRADADARCLLAAQAAEAGAHTTMLRHSLGALRDDSLQALRVEALCGSDFRLSN